MKQGSTLFLKTVVILFAIAVLALSTLLVYGLITKDIGGYQPIVIGMLLTAMPFFMGVYQVLTLLHYIDTNKVFSGSSIRALKTVKYCGAAISALYAIGMPYIYFVAKQDDAPGVILIGLIFTFAPMIVAVFAAVLQNLLQNAIDLKSENELTV